MRKLTITMDEWNALALDALRKRHAVVVGAEPQFFRGNQEVMTKDTAYGLPTALTIDII